MTILTYDKRFYHSNYSRQTTLVDEYKANVLLYLRKMIPDATTEELEREISLAMKETYKPTKVMYLSSPSEGNIDIKEDNLLDVTNAMNENILTPYGSSYVQVSERKSLFIDVITDAQADRKVVKKDMLAAEARGDEATAMIKHLRQLNIKIGINVISGVMLSNVAFRSGINYNSITATARFSTMLAYSYTELMLENNFYFYNEGKAINWIVNLLRIYPGDEQFQSCIDKYKLAIPDIETVIEHYKQQVNAYSKFSKNLQLKQLITSLTTLEVAFIYYACNLNKIFRDNDQFKVFFSKVFEIDQLPLVKDDIGSIYELNDEIIFIMTTVMLADELKGIILEEVDKDHPEIARKIYTVYHHLEYNLNKLELLFNTLTMLPIVPSEVGTHKSMIRKTVLLSDTDSILFTTKNWIEWFTNDIKITKPATAMNAMMIAIIAKMLEHIFAYNSACMNVAEADLKELQIKNEFMYDIFMRTPISKHYAGYVRFREGIQQNPYKFDLKGKNFKGSDLCNTTIQFVNKFIRNIFDDYLRTYEIAGIDLIKKTIKFEQRIKETIQNGDVTFLGQKPINLPRDYKNVESSNYVYYTMWMEVFSGKYPEINLPQKCKELPIQTISKKNPKAIIHLKSTNPEMFDRFMIFLDKYPKRKFSRVLLPMDMDIPDELRSICDYRKVCATNCFSIYLILKSFNIVNHTHRKKSTLFSDVYKSLLQEVLEDDRRDEEEKEEGSS